MICRTFLGNGFSLYWVSNYCVLKQFFGILKSVIVLITANPCTARNKNNNITA